MLLQARWPALSILFSLVFSTRAAYVEKLTALPNGWTQVGTPADGDTMTLQIGLQQQNLDQLDFMIYSVSTPGSELYGKYMEADEVAAMLQPSSEANTAVLAWLKGSGVSNVYSDGTWVSFSTTVGTANTLLGTTFNYYENDGVRKLRTTSYSVPDELTDHVDLVTPTTYFGKTTAQAPGKMHFPNRRIAPRQLNTTCETLITPACIRELYNIGDYTPDPKSGSTIAFGSFLNQSARTQDLSLFEAANSIPQQGFSVQLINGGVNDQALDDNHGEANLDVEYIIGVSHPLPVISYITGGSPPFIPNLDEPTAADNENEPYLSYYQYLLAQPNSALPNVISNSYSDDEQTVPGRYAKRVCNMIGMLGLRGISVLESAGDTGKGPFQYVFLLLGVGSPCQSNDGKKTPQFTPQFPPTCPYITAVGGTQSINPEIAWVAGSGGFSNYFTRPHYQTAAVSNYLNNHISEETLAYFTPFFNISGRGFPDVSAHSLTPDYSVILNNNASLSGGTSAAVPVFSSIVALLNDARFRAGKPALGFLNPWLYATGYIALTDITGGGSEGCSGINLQTGAVVPNASIIPYASWNATQGWDPVTGLGVPNFQKLLALALA